MRHRGPGAGASCPTSRLRRGCAAPSVHLVLVPSSEDGLARGIGEAHRLAAVRYVETNPVRARLCRKPWRYPWSSAAAHVAGEDDGLVKAARSAELTAEARCGRSSPSTCRTGRPTWPRRHRPRRFAACGCTSERRGRWATRPSSESWSASSAAAFAPEGPADQGETAKPCDVHRYQESVGLTVGAASEQRCGRTERHRETGPSRRGSRPRSWRPRAPGCRRSRAALPRRTICPRRGASRGS